ncbi:hypothetical protein chiPu_0011955 [Chiloscyllium punctatum]|uniref:Uncharacterized protein n=1 Tax=Chiloscyllium punctatum TaxID=137246 RepID=A0A401SSY3_CHIPU|nr:hypothetical protein [Chiloscyllium punctatum]
MRCGISRINPCIRLRTGASVGALTAAGDVNINAGGSRARAALLFSECGLQQQELGLELAAVRSGDRAAPLYPPPSLRPRPG